MSLSGLMSPAHWFTNWVRGWLSDDDDGRLVNTEQALSLPAIWNGVSRISGHIGQLPLNVFRRLEQGAEQERMHNAAVVLRRPTPYMTSIMFRETMAAHSLLDGDGRAAIVRAGSRIAELILLHPDCTATGMLNGIKVHATRPPQDDRARLFFPTVNEREDDRTGVIMLDDADVIHIPGLSSDGVCGYPLKRIGGRSLRSAINAEKRVNYQLEKGFAGNIMLNAPSGVFTKQSDAEEFLDYFEKRHHSSDKAGKPGLLRNGITAQILAMNNKDAEMIEQRKFQRQEAALWLGLEQILGDDSSVSYNSLEQKLLAYLMNCLNRWLKRWEEELEFKLLPTMQFETGSHYIRFNTGALLKSDYKTSVESLALAIGSRIMNPNEAREKLDMNPYEGGDSYENPAITPGDGGDPAEQAEPSDGDDGEPRGTVAALPSPSARVEGETQAMLAVRARMQHLIGVEAGKVKAAAKQAQEKGKNFVAWLDDFYGSKWLPKLSDAAEEIGLDRDVARVHCEESKARLLEVLDYSQPAQLAENVAKCVSNWRERANTIGEPANV